ncbi:MAG: LytTR family transcriptional regulator [Clostridia bacterium]|nr:LytTR family transcriptional regulator [Clostridia bacterium]MBQ4323301.1 LytTR family transcriptional regulator [Clostridia bacterium]
MKCRVVIDPQREEEIVIYTHARTPLVEAVEALTRDASERLIGYREGEGLRLSWQEVCCFTVEDNKVYALTAQGKWMIKGRLYQLEEAAPPTFVKINQSTLANLKQIERFDTSIAGTLKVKFKNGTVDYVSRRNLKQVKERLGIR